MDRKQQIIREIKRVASAISPERLTLKSFKGKSVINERLILYHFGTWNAALQAAGLEPNPPSIPVTGTRRISDEDLLNEIGELWRRTGKKPTAVLMNSQGKFSEHPYATRWGSWSKAIEAYVEQRGNDPSKTKTSRQDLKPKVTLHDQPLFIRPRIDMQTPGSKKKRRVYGEPIDFRGLVHAPVNEQGVVYLFGMVSKELGFLVESIQSGYPDCEGKRRLDVRGRQWERVSIEFEYKSTEFKRHAHDPQGCDLIVCWIHDWEDCPLEVVELRSIISSLPRG